MSLFGKIATLLARKVLIPAVVKIAQNPKAPLNFNEVKGAVIEAAKDEGIRQVGKRLGE